VRIAVNPKVYRVKYPRQRKTRRLVYLAAIAHRMGHKVRIHNPCGYARYKFQDVIRTLPEDRGKLATPPDVYLCSHALLLKRPDVVPKGCKVVAWKESLRLLDDQVLADMADLIVGYVWKPKDWTFRNVKVRPGHLENVAHKYLQVPWLCHDRVLEALHSAKLTNAYLDDDLPAIRSRFGSTEKKRKVGFIGHRLPHRSKIMERVEAAFGFEIKRWAGGHDPGLPPGEYLRWLTECELNLNLEGDTWGCSRLAECAMMGAAVVQCRPDRFDYDPPISAENAIVCNDWADAPTILAGLDRAPDAARGASEAYCGGWSLRGQLNRVFARLGVA